MFFNRQVFVKLCPPINSVPSGIVTSLTNWAALQGNGLGVAVGGIAVGAGCVAVGGTSVLVSVGNTVGSSVGILVAGAVGVTANWVACAIRVSKACCVNTAETVCIIAVCWVKSFESGPGSGFDERVT